MPDCCIIMASCSYPREIHTERLTELDVPQNPSPRMPSSFESNLERIRLNRN